MWGIIEHFNFAHDFQAKKADQQSLREVKPQIIADYSDLRPGVMVFGRIKKTDDFYTRRKLVARLGRDIGLISAWLFCFDRGVLAKDDGGSLSTVGPSGTKAALTAEAPV